MVDHTVLYSFLAFLAFFIFVGLLSVTKRQKSAEDYLLASRSMSPAFVGLSAAASTASGFGFTGIIGFGYAMGLAGGLVYFRYYLRVCCRFCGYFSTFSGVQPTSECCILY